MSMTFPQILPRLVLWAALCVGAVAAPAQQQEVRTTLLEGQGGADDSLSDILAPGEGHDYIFSANAGTRLTLSLKTDAAGLRFAIEPPMAYSDFPAIDPSDRSFNMILEAGGGYRVSIRFAADTTGAEPADYVLEFSLSTDTPDRRLVRTSGAALNMRDAPSTSGRIVSRLPNGATVELLECNDARRPWCRVRLPDGGFGGGPEGWVAGAFLADPPTALDPPPPDTRDVLDCYVGDAHPDPCPYTIQRTGDGSGSLSIDLPDGSSRSVSFANGTPIPPDGFRLEATDREFFVSDRILAFAIPRAILNAD
ncbi:MAG: SH3 domain-containing protein [Pseudomonadota bacterium]